MIKRMDIKFNLANKYVAYSKLLIIRLIQDLTMNKISWIIGDLIIAIKL